MVAIADDSGDAGMVNFSINRFRSHKPQEIQFSQAIIS